MKKITGLMAVALVAVFSAFTTAGGGYKVGDKASDFKLKNVNDKMVSLADYKDARGIILVFTCNHCPFAKKYESRIMDLDKQFKSKGFPVVAISPNDPVAEPTDSFENMQKRAKEKAYSFPYLIDETQNVTREYGATKTPHVFILEKQKDASYVVRYIGAIDDNSDDIAAVKEKYVENAVNNILAGKPVTPDNTKAIGCGIKWKS